MICREYKKINELFNQVNDVAVEMCRGEGRGGGGDGQDRTVPRLALRQPARRAGKPMEPTWGGWRKVSSSR